MFADSGDVTSNASVASSALQSAKTTGDLDSDLHHAVKWTPLLRPRGAIFKLVFSEAAPVLVLCSSVAP